MYTRNYLKEETQTIVPENYDGNAFCKSYSEEKKAEQSSVFLPPPFEEDSTKTEKDTGLSIVSLIEKTPLKALLSFLPGKNDDGEKKINIGTEEILICAAALYMLLSKNGDKECAIMLFVLLFIK